MAYIDADVAAKVQRIGERLSHRRLTLVTAESCTGGLLAAQFTELPGSSAWFEGALVTYRLSAKQNLLGVSAQSLAAHGAVSQVTATAMARGALQRSTADISIAVTGIAGPGGATEKTPMGTVWIAWCSRDGLNEAHRYQFEGDRGLIREMAVRRALQGLLDYTGETPV